MMATNFVDELDFFDTIDDLLEFPPEEDSTKESLNATPTEIPTMWTNPSQGFDATAAFSTNTSSDLSTQLSVPYEDMVQLEWLSTFVEESFSDKSIRDRRSHSSSPVSVLESGISGENPIHIPIPIQNPQERHLLGCSKPGKSKSRSKRHRPAAFNPRLPFQLISPYDAKIPSELGNYDGKKKPKKLKRMKLMTNSAPEDAYSSQATQSQYVRKCQHCEITKTPQWRAGPMGPKTLCNACGVRHKSGRLLPEYRPAASPTFVPAMHSNSHKKVLEMRVKVGAEASSPAPSPAKETLKISSSSPSAVQEVVTSKNDAIRDDSNAM